MIKQRLMGLIVACVLMAPGLALAQTYKVGDRVQCDATQIGQFAPGQVVEIEPRAGWPDPFYMVVLAGERDPSRCLEKFMRPAAAAPAVKAPVPGARPAQSAQRPAAGGLCRKGAKLEAAWGISWYAATVLEAANAQGQCLVHFDGYPSLYDLPVNAEIGLRPTGSGPIVRPDRPVAAAPQRAAPVPAGAKAPNGTYACHKMSPSAPMISLGSLVVSGGTPSYRGLPNGWKLRGINYKGKDAQGRDLVVVDYTSTAGFNDRIDCVK